MIDERQSRSVAAGAAPAGAGLAPLLVDAGGAARLCGVSRATWFQWQAAGLIPPAALRRGRVVRWDRRELEDWISAGCPSADAWRTIRAGGGRKGPANA